MNNLHTQIRRRFCAIRHCAAYRYTAFTRKRRTCKSTIRKLAKGVTHPSIKRLKNQFAVFIFALLGVTTSAAAQETPVVSIHFTLPKLDVSPYHRPYVAVWLETPKRRYVTTIALWADDAEWHKDLRQWWRRASRSPASFDSVTGATRRPDAHQIHWQGRDLNNEIVPGGEYLLNIEVVREEGGRDFIRQPITLNQHNHTSQAKSKTEVTQFYVVTFPNNTP